MDELPLFMLKAHNLFFDLDGTLLDTAPGIIRAYRYAIEQSGFSAPSAESLRWCLGPPLRENFPKIFGSNDPQLVTRAVELYREHYSGGAMFDFTIYDGVESLLAVLAESGRRMFVLTSKPVFFSRPILNESPLAHFFEELYGPELDGRFDDKTEHFREIIRELQIDPADSAVVGDRARDIIAGRSNGAGTVGVTWGYGTTEELSAADYLVHSPAGLRELLSSERPFTE